MTPRRQTTPAPAPAPTPTPDARAGDHPLLAVHGMAIATRRRHIGPFSLRVAPGELVAVTGANGSGKTTLLRLALGLEQATAGTSTVLGRRVDPRHPPLGVGAVLDADGLAPWRSGRDELRVGCTLVGADPRRADELLAQVGLRPAADDPVRTYSRGMRQRLAIAWALLGHPRLLVMDEPTVALDADACTWLGDLLAEHVAGGGSAVVATHDHAWLDRRATRTVVVADGRST